jgi:hypothetical protein
MSKRKTKSIKKKKTKSFLSLPNNNWLYFVLLIPIFFTLYLFFYMYSHEQRLIPFYFISLYIGIFYSSYMLTKQTDSIILCTIIAYYASFLTFIPKLNAEYNLDSRITTWPYVFLFIYLAIITIQFKNKTMPKISEGLSFLFSISLLYWLYDLNKWSLATAFATPLRLIITLYVGFAVLHAFTQFKLNPVTRFILSLGTSLIVISLAIHNILALYQRGDLLQQTTLLEEMSIAIQYFLLGTSSIFLFMNVMLIIQFLPNKYTRNYINDLKEVYNDHIERFSQSQLTIFEALLALIITTPLFYLNHHYQWFPATTMIWMIFIILPLIINKFMIQITPTSSNIVVTEKRIKPRRSKRKQN